MLFLKCFPNKCLVAFAASLSLLSAVYAEEAAVPPNPTDAQSSGSSAAATANGAEGSAENKANEAPSHTPEAKADPKKAAELERGIIEANAQAGSRPAEQRPASAAPAAKSGQPMKLYGRIEELSAGTGAKIPLKMVAMTPVRDTSFDQKPTKLNGKATTLSAAANMVQTFPIDYRGTWSGELTLNSANYDPGYFQVDRATAEKEARMMRPGMRGSFGITFYQGNDNKIQAQPSQVTFQTTDTLAGSGGLNVPGGMGANNPMIASMGNMQVPVFLSLHFGAPMQSYEHGVTGNQLSKELMKNTLRELSRGVLEQQVVTKDAERSADGRTHTGYSESVLRFTRLNSSQMYVQAAYVGYNAQGRFQMKYLLYGTLNRSNGYSPPTQPANPFGNMMGNPFGGMMPGGSGAQNPGQSMQDAANQMQKLLQQMGGR